MVSRPTKRIVDVMPGQWKRLLRGEVGTCIVPLRPIDVDHRPITRLICMGLAVALVMLVPSGPTGAQTAGAPAADAALFEKIAGVLRHPRCLNCHQREVPLQGDRSWKHIPKISRDAPTLADGSAACARCHAGEGPATGIPGVPGWRMPPVEAAWQDLTTAQLCQAIKSPKTNGGRELPALVEHLDHDALVLWAWEPGRAPPPISHKEFVDLARFWASTGAVCPQ